MYVAVVVMDVVEVVVSVIDTFVFVDFVVVCNIKNGCAYLSLINCCWCYCCLCLSSCC